MTKEQNEELLIQLQEIADMFYQNRLESGIAKLPNFVQELNTYLMQLPLEVQGTCLLLVKNVMEAMETKEYVLLADVLVFELQPFIEDN